MARAFEVAALLLLCAVAAQATRFHVEEADNGRLLMQAGKAPNCSRIDPACQTCRNQRIPGTRRSELVCATCRSGYRLRRDGISKTCDCAPGLFKNESGVCVACTRGKFCTGGDAANSNNTASTCPVGLETTFEGAKSQAQCFTQAGYGRKSTRGSDGKVTLSAEVCAVGTYNVGANTAGCQKCGAGLTTASNGSTSSSACVAPAGSYMDKGIGKLCQRGTYSTDLNSNNTCIPCPAGTTTAAEGSRNISDCGLALKGYYISSNVAAGEAPASTICPVDTYQDQEAPATSCTACPYGWRTKEAGATGVALCLAPPGWELKAGEATISQCAIGSYKADWNRNPCVPCGTNIITTATGSVSKDACLVPPGYGLTAPDAAAKCEKNTYGDNENRAAVANARCTPCPADMFTLDTIERRTIGAGANANELYTSQQACLVQPGWGTTNTQPQQCPKGTFNAGKNRAPCTSCPTGFTTEAAGKESAAACVIQPGWEMATNGIPVPCDKGEYSTGGTEALPNATCSSCPTGFSTQEDESTRDAECAVCAPGYGGDNCQECPYNTFASGGAKVGDACQSCANGAVSKKRATQVQQCYAATIDARNDVFNLGDESQWTAAAASIKTGSACSAECLKDAACAMYKFVGADGSGVCSLLVEVTPGTHKVGFKIGNGDDYSVWQTNTIVGASVGTPTAATEAACKDACSASAECEVYNFVTATSACTLTKSELEQDAISMFQVLGNHLYSDLN